MIPVRIPGRFNNRGQEFLQVRRTVIYLPADQGEKHTFHET